MNAEPSWEERVRQSQTVFAAAQRCWGDQAASKRARWHQALARRAVVPIIYERFRLPWSYPTPLPRYLIKEAGAHARQILDFLRRELAAGGRAAIRNVLAPLELPDLPDELADWLLAHFARHDPHLAFDFLIILRDRTGRQLNTRSWNWRRAEQAIAAGQAVFDFAPLELQTIDCYQLGWYGQEVIPLTQEIFGIPADQLWLTEPRFANRRQFRALARRHYGPAAFVEIDPEAQPSYTNVQLLAKVCGGIIVRPETLARTRRPLVSRIVHSDFTAWRPTARPTAWRALTTAIRDPSRWRSPNFHPFGFYWGNKATFESFARLRGVTGTRFLPTFSVSEALDGIKRGEYGSADLVVKPTLGQSAQEVNVAPTRAELEAAARRREPFIVQPLIHPVRFLPTPQRLRGRDPDADLGVATEARLLMSAGEPFGSRAQLVTIMTRNAFISTDPRRKIRGDPAGRGWYTNVGAILLVLEELGLNLRRDASHGLGCGVGVVTS